LVPNQAFYVWSEPGILSSFLRPTGLTGTDQHSAEYSWHFLVKEEGHTHHGVTFVMIDLEEPEARRRRN